MGESILSDRLNTITNEAKGKQVKIPEQRQHCDSGNTLLFKMEFRKINK